MPKRNTSKKQNSLQSRSASCDSDVIAYQDINKVHPALRQYTGYCLHKVTTIFKAKVNGIFEEFGIQGHHFAVLSVISSTPEINQIKICDEMGIDKASMVKITDRLEKLKFIERVASTEDRRVKNLLITAKGSKFLQTTQAKRVELEKEFFANFSDSEVKNFRDMLLKILDEQRGGSR